jgi:hypothetical protein
MIRASTENDVDNGLAGWICRDCLGGTGIPLTTRPVEAPRPVNVQRPAVQPLKHTTSDPQSLVSRLPPAKKDLAVKVLKYKQSISRPLDKRSERMPSKHSSHSSSSTPMTTENAARTGDISRANAATKISPTLVSQASRVSHAGHVAEQARSEDSSASRRVPHIDLQYTKRPPSQLNSRDDNSASKPLATSNATRSSTIISNAREPSSSRDLASNSQAKITDVDARKSPNVCLC